MKFYLDSADIEEIREAKNLPIFAGVTTNPILLERAQVIAREKFYNKVLRLIPGKDLFVQVFSKNPSEVYNEALSLARISRKRIIIKITVNNELIDVAYRLTQKGIRVCLTAVSNIRQIAIASLLGIEYCAVYLKRLLDRKREIYNEIEAADEMIDVNSYRTRILIASLPEERLIEPLLRYKNLDYTLPFKPFMNILWSEESENWIKGFYEITNKNIRKR